MKNESNFWSGVFPAVVTQMNEDQSIDFDASARFWEAQIEAGVHGLIVCGSLGENQCLQADEKRAVVKHAVQVAAGRVPVISGVAEMSTRAAISYLQDAMPVEVVFYDGRAISVELPTSVVREIETEPAVKGDTSGKVMKPARIVGTGFEIAVPLFVESGDKIEIDTRTHEYKKRV